MSPAVLRSRPAAAVSRWRSGCCSGFGREGEQVCPQGRPGGFGGESGNVLVGLVELGDGVGSESCSAATWRPSV
jgi:hypothetical protein